jgi:hypothetical protein
MFLASLCITASDLVRLEFVPDGIVPNLECETRSRAVLHRLCKTDSDFAQLVTDVLDLRYADIVFRLRALPADAAALYGSLEYLAECGLGVAGVAWALLTDEREEVHQAGRRLMGECYVAGMRRMSAEFVGVPPVSRKFSPDSPH